jgi:hypothetical protein
MKTIGALLGLLLMVSTIGCQTQRVVYPDVDYDFNITTDFSDIKTYTWHPTSGGVKVNHLTIARVQNAVDSQLQAKGLEISLNEPDFYIVLYGGTYQEYTTRWRGWDDNLLYNVGRIKLAFFDTQTNKIIWWGETRADVFFYMEPEEKDKIVGDAVTRILTKYPPNKTEEAKIHK